MHSLQYDIISIHALLAESDGRPTGRPAYHTGFLSTLSLRRATASVFLIGSRSQFLSTLSLRRATRTGLTCGDGRNISIHALLAESDKLVNVHNNPTTKFLSTLSLRRATKHKRQHNSLSRISIHALLAESDAPMAGTIVTAHISIHALLAESDWRIPQNQLSANGFLSTLSLRRATASLT